MESAAVISFSFVWLLTNDYYFPPADCRLTGSDSVQLFRKPVSGRSMVDSVNLNSSSTLFQINIFGGLFNRINSIINKTVFDGWSWRKWNTIGAMGSFHIWANELLGNHHFITKEVRRNFSLAGLRKVMSSGPPDKVKTIPKYESLLVHYTI